MKTIYSIIGGLFIAVSGSGMASDSWYLGQVAGHYILDTDAANEGNVEGSQVGLQLGKHLTNNVALEIGYGEGTSHDDINVTSLAAILWFGAESDSWRPYGLLGGNYYDFDATNNWSVGHKSSYGRAIAGVGVGTMVDQNYQFRAGVRGMLGGNEEEIGVHLSLNRVFGPKAASAPAVTASNPMIAVLPKVRTITISLNVKFEFNKDVVLAVYSEELATIASAMMEQDDIDLVLQGHTDSTGPVEYNRGLSERRAQAVKIRLSADYGIPGNRISAVGYGEARPIESNDTREGRKLNRRVVGEMSYSEVELD